MCDVYEPNLEAGFKEASTGARSFRDYRRLLDDKSFDAVIVATPDHWHARMVIDAVEAGKDVYVEKPLAHTIDEGFAMIEAVRRTKRVVQVGMQRRSAELFLEAKQIMDAGRLGDIRLVTSAWYNNQASLSDRKLAGDLDWKQWLGSAPGAAGRLAALLQLVLLLGLLRRAAGRAGGAYRRLHPVVHEFEGAARGDVHRDDAGGLAGAEVPETATIAIEYPENYLATFTLGYKAMRYNPFNDQIKQFHGDKARLDVGREWYALYPETERSR